MRPEAAAQVEQRALPVFEAAVNSGRRRAVLWLREALGGIAVDRVIGPQPQGAVRRVNDRASVIGQLAAPGAHRAAARGGMDPGKLMPGN